MRTLLLILILFTVACKPTKESQTKDHSFDNLLRSNPELQKFISAKDSLNIQIIYTKIDRDKNNKPVFTDHTFNTDPNKYFYPASTVKMPGAFLALEKLNELNSYGINMNSYMQTDSSYVGQSKVPHTSKATIARYIKEIFLVSDNEAFNRLYEFLGQEYINHKVQQKGLDHSIIRHRLAVNMTDEQHRNTNPVSFYDSNGKLLYSQPARYSKLNFSERTIKLGKGFYRSGKLVNEPFDFSLKNNVALLDLHNMLRSVIFHDHIKPSQRFNHSQADRKFLLHWMSALPKESKDPTYDTAEFYDNFAKFLPRSIMQNEDVRVFSKAGWAYGFLTDIAYIVDFKNNIEFMLSATILCNSDGLFNDDKYDFETTGYPFMKLLGETIYQVELQRKRSRKPNLSEFKIDYTIR